ncbi:MAG: LamG-like jellyroll fold domain-containing protein [Verrucomicrobiota bacterium]|nr:LamG-like jellyroll fold domain-containing protein [Verrucomicrobiota bacterium]
MSDVLYPISLIREVRVTHLDRTVSDSFEDGSTSARSLWAARSFKRRIEVRHAPLSARDERHLRGFYAQRNGQQDSFWFRDNVNRGGNVKVRFTAPLSETRGRGVYEPEVMLEEVGPLRRQPEVDELYNAVSSANALLWLDANREAYVLHSGAVVLPNNYLHDETGNYQPIWQSGSFNPDNIVQQHCSYRATGGQWARTFDDVTGLSGTQPAGSIFLLAKHSASSGKQVLLAVGAMGTGAAMGIALSAANVYEPWTGGSETWTGCVQSNAVANTWRSLALVWAAASNTATLYVNGVSVGTGSNTRNFSLGRLAFHAAMDGTLKANAAGTMAACDTQHAMLFNTALTLAQVKALHNMVGYQYGLATVL